MKLIEVIMMELDIKHKPGVKVGNALGSPFYVLIQMTSPGLIGTSPTDLKRIETYECMLFQPGMPRYIGPLEDTLSYSNNWAYIQGDGVVEALERYGVATECIYHPYALEEVTQCFGMLMSAFNFPGENRSELMSLILRQMFIHLTGSNQFLAKSGENNVYYEEKLAQMRHDMYNDVSRAWCIADIAREIGISMTWLDKLYRAKYGLSPKQDLLHARIERSKNYLAYTNISLRELAQITGFQNEYYFSQVFHRQVGLSPGQYRRRMQKEGR